jgi:hypothetical protein
VAAWVFCCQSSPSGATNQLPVKRGVAGDDGRQSEDPADPFGGTLCHRTRPFRIVQHGKDLLCQVFRCTRRHHEAGHAVGDDLAAAGHTSAHGRHTGKRRLAQRAADRAQRQRQRRLRRIRPAPAVDSADDLHVRQAARRQRHQQPRLGVAGLSDIRAHAREEPGERPDCGKVGQWVHKPLECEGVEFDAGLHEWRRIAPAGGADPKPVLTQEKHERNAEIVVLASDIEHMWRRQRSLLVRKIRQPHFTSFGSAAVSWSKDHCFDMPLEDHLADETFS